MIVCMKYGYFVHEYYVPFLVSSSGLCSQCLAYDVVDFTLRNKTKLTSPVNYIEKFFPSLLKVPVICIKLYAYIYAYHSMSFTVVA